MNGNLESTIAYGRPDTEDLKIARSFGGACSLCGTCADTCPLAAVSVSEQVATNKELCIICCACVKNCPTGARVIQKPDIERITTWLYTNYSARKEPETYI